MNGKAHTREHREAAMRVKEDDARATRSSGLVRRRKTQRTGEEKVRFTKIMSRRRWVRDREALMITQTEAVQSRPTTNRRTIRRSDRPESLHRAAVVLLDAAVVAAVGEIDHQPDDQPDDQPRPVDPAELVHHVAVEEDAQDGHERHPRRAERARLARDWSGAARSRRCRR